VMKIMPDHFCREIVITQRDHYRMAEMLREIR